jgi:hypothetical protein
VAGLWLETEHAAHQPRATNQGLEAQGVTTELSSSVRTARKRVISAALSQRHPSRELVRALNHYLTLARHELAVKNDECDGCENNPANYGGTGDEA